MKLKSLFLGSVAAAGLSTAGLAADLGVLTSLDNACDKLGYSGLTISSSDNCLQISGGVSYEFIWGDYRTEADVARTFDGTRKVPVDNGDTDWATKVEAWLKFVGTAPSDFGPASAVIKLKETDITRVNRGTGVDAGDATATVFVDNDGKADAVQIDEAYVSIGDSTVIMAGRKGSIANLSDDEPFNFLGLFNSDAIDGKGILVDGDTTYLGGHVIQVVSDLGNGVNVGVGLENLNGDSNSASADEDLIARHGTLVGVVSYAGDGVTAHITGAALGILDGDVESWFVHAGASGTFDVFKVRGAVGYWEDRNFADVDVLNALVSAEASFDLFKIALSGEVANVEDGALGDYTDYGFGGSVGVAVTEGVAINLGARYFRDDLNDLDTTQVALQAVAAVTETIKLTGEVGAYFGDGVTADARIDENVYYGAAELAWAPGGGFTSSLKGEVFSTEAYKVTFKAAKSFE